MAAEDVWQVGKDPQGNILRVTNALAGIERALPQVERSTVKAYYVDSIGFVELPDFFKERNMDLQKENLLNEKLQEIEIFDKPGLFSNGRLRDEDVPEGLYRYDLRGSDYDPGQPITVEKTVVVNHAASVLMAEELDLGAEGRLELGEGGLNFTGAELIVREFMLVGGFVIFMIPQVVGVVVVLLELAAVMLRQAWYI